MCGGTGKVFCLITPLRGLSPRVRGNPRCSTRAGRSRRSIPACAGEPRAGPGIGGREAVYPRVCGGTVSSASAMAWARGLSPRVRGNLAVWATWASSAGSIPACAGEPRWQSSGTDIQGVYPRVCGGTWGGVIRRAAAWGLSPRVRGNPLTTGPRERQFGSIPACAGEPGHRHAGGFVNQVYPRVCGGTGVVGFQHIAGAGSIPACAGEPRRCPAGRRGPAVYPRVCGGTPLYQQGILDGMGLSPRVRGNRRHPQPAISGAGSIPACAGEPVLSRWAGGLCRVYPRVCGGTRGRCRPTGPGIGLSPRVRGNR